MNMIMIIIITHSQLAMGSRPAEYCNFNSKASAHAYHHMILDVISNEQMQFLQIIIQPCGTIFTCG